MMTVDKAMQVLNLTWGRGTKIKCDPFARASESQKTWHASASRLNVGTEEQMQQTAKIEQADYAVMTAWELLTRLYCNVCGYVVHPRLFHGHCPDCRKLMREKMTGQTDDGYPIFRIWCRCGYEDVNIQD